MKNFKGKEKERASQTITQENNNNNNPQENNNPERLLLELQQISLNMNLNEERVIRETTLTPFPTIARANPRNGEEPESFASTFSTMDLGSNRAESSIRNKNKSQDSEENIEREEETETPPPLLHFDTPEEMEKVIEENHIDGLEAQELRRLAAMQSVTEGAGGVRQMLGLQISRNQKINERLKNLLKEINGFMNSHGRTLGAFAFASTAIGVFIMTLRTGNLPIGTGQAIASAIARSSQQVAQQVAERSIENGTADAIGNSVNNNILNNPHLQTGVVSWFIGFLMRNARFFRR